MGECQECGRPCEAGAPTCPACSAAAVGDLALPAPAARGDLAVPAPAARGDLAVPAPAGRGGLAVPASPGRHRADPSQLPTEVLSTQVLPPHPGPATAAPPTAAAGESWTALPDGDVALASDLGPHDLGPHDLGPHDPGPHDPGPDGGPARRRVPLAVLALLGLLAIGLGSGLAALRGGPDPDRAAAPVLTSPAATATPSDTPEPSETATQESPTPTSTTSSPSPTTTRPSPSTTKPSPTAPPPGAAQQVVALGGLMDSAGGIGDLVAGSVAALQGQCGGRGDYGRGVSGLNQAIGARQQLLGALGGVDVSAVPHGGEVKDALRRAWQSSADAARGFLAAAERAGAGNCPARGEQWRDATRKSQESRAAKGVAARVWNSQIAPVFGVPRRQEGRL